MSSYCLTFPFDEWGWSAAKLTRNIDINSYQEGSRIRSSVKVHKNFLKLLWGIWRTISSQCWHRERVSIVAAKYWQLWPTSAMLPTTRRNAVGAFGCAQADCLLVCLFAGLEGTLSAVRCTWKWIIINGLQMAAHSPVYWHAVRRTHRMANTTANTAPNCSAERCFSMIDTV